MSTLLCTIPSHAKTRYIVHFDGDAFFASVEQAKNHKLKGKCVITGRERGIAAAMSYEAKRKGVTRGMRLSEIKKVCPEAIILESDYDMYCVYARRMYNIVRRYTPFVEEYSIDECFADITDVKMPAGMTHADLALQIKQELEQKLDITFGVGVGPNKVLAKVASKHRKPAGFTVIEREQCQVFTAQVAIHKVWGIGSSMSMYLRQRGIETALDFAQKDEAWLRVHQISKPYREIWYELQGYFVKELAIGGRVAADIGSIMKTRTFTPATSDKQFIFSQLSKNVEHACERARYYGVQSRAITFFIKTSEFRYKSVELELPVPTSAPNELLRIIEPYFSQLYDKRLLYRASGITLRSLIEEQAVTGDLFGMVESTRRSEHVFSIVDDLNQAYGSHTVFLGSSLAAREKEAKEDKLSSSSKKQYVFELPFVGMVSNYFRPSK